jgi:hypothetical protein
VEGWEIYNILEWKLENVINGYHLLIPFLAVQSCKSLGFLYDSWPFFSFVAFSLHLSTLSSSKLFSISCSHAQVVSCRLPTMTARVWAWVWSCGICGGHSGAGAGFFRVLWFPLPIFIKPIVPQSPSSIIWGWCNMPVVAAVPNGLSLTPLRIIKENHAVTSVQVFPLFFCPLTYLQKFS